MPVSYKTGHNPSQAERVLLQTLMRQGPGPADPKLVNPLIREGLAYKLTSNKYAITHRGEGVIS